MTTPQTSAGTLRAQLVLNVTYALNGMSAQAILDHLTQSFERAIGDGALSGHTEAEVEEHSMDVLQVHAELDEDQLAAFMSQRIADGDLDEDDIPVRLARYGLMNPASFINEMSERMQGDDDAFEAPIKMRIFDFGMAPQAVTEGYEMKGLLQSTPDELKAAHGSEDLIFVYGASVHGSPGLFEFARFEPKLFEFARFEPKTAAVSEQALAPVKRLNDGGNAYGLLGGVLVSAPINADGSIDDQDWYPVEFEMIAEGEAAYCRLIQQALEAMSSRDQ